MADVFEEALSRVTKKILLTRPYSSTTITIRSTILTPE
jgi:hypothetical protein